MDRSPTVDDLGSRVDLFAGILPFLRVAETGSFRGAAKAMGLSVAAVSKAVAKLEADLGVSLLERSSRYVGLTAEGAAFYERSRGAVEELRAAREQASQAQRGLRGAVRVAFPPVLGETLLPVVDQVLARHPRISIDLVATDRQQRLAQEEIDVALRMGPLEDSALVARPLRRPAWVTVASPEYLAIRGTPASPADLAQHECLRFVLHGRPVDWQFQDGASVVTVAIPSRLRVDSGVLLLDAASRGMGLAQLFDFMAAPLISTGRVIQVLKRYAAPGPELHALTTARRAAIPRVRVLLDALAETFARGKMRRRASP